MIEATPLPAAWQVRFRAGQNEGLANTVKEGVGGAAGMRPHELLEASLATCMTITARMALAEVGSSDAGVTVRVQLEREESVTRFRYEVALPPALERHRTVVLERVQRSPVLVTLSRQLTFEPAGATPASPR